MNEHLALTSVLLPKKKTPLGNSNSGGVFYCMAPGLFRTTDGNLSRLAVSDYAHVASEGADRGFKWRSLSFSYATLVRFVSVALIVRQVSCFAGSTLLISELPSVFGIYRPGPLGFTSSRNSTLIRVRTQIAESQMLCSCYLSTKGWVKPLFHGAREGWKYAVVTSSFS